MRWTPWESTTAALEESLVLAQVLSATVLGVEGHRVSVEVHVADGLPSFTIVGSAGRLGAGVT